MERPVLMFTGHRGISREEKPYIEKKLDEIISEYRDARLFICGGALGFDTLAAKAVLRAKLKYGGIKLLLALPCYDQTSRWPRDARADYEIILACADFVVYTTEGGYSEACMHVRNRFMVDMSDVCVTYFTGRAGGTFSTVRYANAKNKKIISIGNCETRGQLG